MGKSIVNRIEVNPCGTQKQDPVIFQANSGTLQISVGTTESLIITLDNPDLNSDNRQWYEQLCCMKSQSHLETCPNIPVAH
jgi:hypothetical protein